MSDVTYDIDYSLWEMYLAECKALDLKPSLSDYQIFVQEADMDRRENWDTDS